MIADSTNTYRQFCDVMARITEQGENVDRNEAFELINDMLNGFSVGDRQRMDMAAAVSRSTIDGELDDDAIKEWLITAEYLAEGGDGQDIARLTFARVTADMRRTVQGA
jgi:hypothetical protein